MRSKRGVEPQSRLNELLKSKVFDLVREENSNQLAKVIAISGDITLPGLGISETELNLLIENVSIVFHSAATIKFDEPLRIAVNFNTRSTLYILEICRKMKHLMALVHMSTAYSNCDLFEVDEQLYPSPAPPKKIIEMTEWMDDATLDSITPKLLGKRPNTYTYTKALAETLLAEEAGSIPVAIIRPSVVTPVWRKPCPGWVDNLSGMTGMIFIFSQGIMRTAIVKKQLIVDFIPVDMVVNLMVTVAWHTATTRPKTINIYNCASSTVNSMTLGDMARLICPLLLRYPTTKMLRYPSMTFKESRLVNNLHSFFDHLVPAYAVDVVMRLIGKKPMMVQLYKKLHRAQSTLETFSNHECIFKSNNVTAMTQQLQGIDKETFHFDVRDLNWESYFKDYILGIRKFLHKDDEESLPCALKKLQILYYAEKLLSLLLLIGLSFMLLQVPFVSTFWAEVVSI